MLSCRSATASLGNIELCVALLKGFPQGGVLSVFSPNLVVVDTTTKDMQMISQSLWKVLTWVLSAP